MTNKALIKDFRAYVFKEVIPLGKPTKQEKNQLKLTFLGAFGLFILSCYLFAKYRILGSGAEKYLYTFIGISFVCGIIYKTLKSKIDNRRNSSAFDKALEYFENIEFDINANKTVNKTRFYKGHSLYFDDLNVRVTSILTDPPSDKPVSFLDIFKPRNEINIQIGECISLQIDVMFETLCKGKINISSDILEKNNGKTAHKIQNMRQSDNLMVMDDIYFERKFKDFSNKMANDETVLDKTVTNKLVNWKTADSIRFVIEPSHVSIIYKVNHSRFGSNISAAFEADEYKKYDPIVLYYITARSLKQKMMEVFG